MSTTFNILGLPREMVPCPWCAEAKAEGTPQNEHGGYCDPWCNGTTIDPHGHWVNLAEANAASMLRLLGVRCDSASDLYGQIEAGDLRQRIFLARNQPAAREAHTFEGYEVAGGHAGTKVVTDEETGLARIQRMGAGYISGGCSDEQIVRRLGQLDDLAKWAQDNGYTTITWA